MARAYVALVMISLLGCSDPEPAPPYSVVFEASSDPGAPLAGVTLSAGGRAIGTTGADGSLTATLAGDEGAVVPVTVTCPAGHREASPVAPLILRRTIDLATGAPAVTRVSVTCPPAMRHGVVVVRAGGAGNRGGIPVLVDGVEVARTDRSGVAHVALDRAPGTTVSVLLATTAVMPDVTPHDPTTPVTFRDTDDFFLFDQVLEDPPPAPRTIRRRPPRTEVATPTGPCRLGTAGCGPPSRR